MPTIVEQISKVLRLDPTGVAAVLDKQYRLTGAWIDGIEATQSIQYYHAADHLTDPSARGADNSVTLAAYKPIWVRAYVRSGRVGPLAGVTAKLTVARRHNGFQWAPVAVLSPQPPGSLTAQPTADYATERSSTANTLNFIMLSGDCWGILQLTVTLLDSSGSVLDTQTAYADVALVQTLRLRGIMIGYNGPSTANPPPKGPPPPNLTLAAPTLSNLQATAAVALLSMPVQAAGSFAVASTITFNLPLDDARSGAGQCSTNWNSLLSTLATQRTNDGNRSDVVYFGLLPAGMPLNVPGCGSSGLGAGTVGDQQTLVHEIGHGYGFPHAPCGAAGTTDTNYPAYKPYPTASIGEYGLNISTGTVFPPKSTSDYMSYCFPQWMSLYHYSALVGETRLNPSWLSDDPLSDRYAHWKDYLIPDYIPDPPADGDPWKVAQMRPDPIISIIGIVHSPDEIEVTSVARVRAVSTPPGPATRFTAHLLDGNGRALAGAALHDLAPVAGGCGCGGQPERQPGTPPFHFQAMIADVAPGAALAIRAGDAVVWQRTAPDSPPTIGGVEARVSEQGTVRLSWEGEAAGDASDIWVQWSDRAGKIWHGLSAGLTGRQGEVSLAGVPAGAVQLRLLLNDGFSTAVSDPVTIQVPARPPEAAIHAPADGAKLIAGGPLRLWGVASDSAGAPLSPESCLWLVDGREIGRGLDVWSTAPPAGEHRATLIVRAEGQETQRTTTFTTVDDGRAKGSGSTGGGHGGGEHHHHRHHHRHDDDDC